MIAVSWQTEKIDEWKSSRYSGGILQIKKEEMTNVKLVYLYLWFISIYGKLACNLECIHNFVLEHFNEINLFFF